MPRIILNPIDSPSQATQGNIVVKIVILMLIPMDMFRDMEQYIRDKYERRLFMSPEAAASINATLSAHSSRNTGSGGSSFIGHANSPVAVAAMRYPLQMKSLQDMGFTEVAANQEALISTAGNLQQAIEALLSGSASRLQVSSPLTRNGSRERVDTVARGDTINAVSKKTSVVDDLAGIFGAPPPPPITSKMTSSSPSGSAPTVVASSSRHPPTSIMDMDLPVPNQEDGVSEEYEDFESAAHPKDSDGKTFLEASARRTAIFENGFADETPHVSGIPATSNAAGITESAITESRPSIADTSLGSNPWAKSADSTSVGREATGEAFDDIDPFRGYIPPTTSNKK